MNDPILLSLSSANLVFGLEWLPLVGSRVDKLGNRIARRHQATHAVFSGEPTAAIGVVRLSRAMTQRRLLHSAAQNVAELFSSGTIALVFELEQAGYWLVAVHDGVVVARTDRFYATKEDADVVLDALRQAYPQLIILGAQHAPAPPTLAQIEAASTSRSSLALISRWRPVLPWPVQCFALTLVLVLLVPRAWQLTQAGSVSSIGMPAGDPVLAWKDAVARSASNRVVHGVQGTRSLLEIFYSLPVGLGGWGLVQAECTAAADHWRCQAQYRRDHASASNRSFLARVPTDWTVEFTSLDSSRPSWQSTAFGQPLGGYRALSGADIERQFLSSLQAIQPAFTQVRIGKPVPLSMSIPIDAQGRAVPRPAGLSTYASRSVQLSGPLRSASLLVPQSASISWSKASITLREVDKPGLKTSRLNVSLQGVLYEIDVVSSAAATDEKGAARSEAALLGAS